MRRLLAAAAVTVIAVSLTACAPSSKSGYVVDKTEHNETWTLELRTNDTTTEVKVSEKIYNDYEVGDYYPRSL